MSGVPCIECGRDVPAYREEFAWPTCEECLPPPPPIPVRHANTTRCRCDKCKETSCPGSILGEVPTEFFEGEWHFPKADGPEPWAVITYADEPSPETGHVGWCWWALGMMGDAPTYEDAKRKAETWIQARINGMPASGRWA